MTTIRTSVNSAILIVTKCGVDTLIIHHIVSIDAFNASPDNIVLRTSHVICKAGLVLQVETLSTLVA